MVTASCNPQVVSAIGASETQLDFSAPKRIDGDAAISLVQTAASLGVEQFVMVTSLGTGKFGWPAGESAFSVWLDVIVWCLTAAGRQGVIKSRTPQKPCLKGMCAGMAGVLNLFGGVLIYKKKAEEALEKSGMAYTIVRPGGMERPQDDYKNTHNLVLQTRDKMFGGQVSRLQVAELIGAAVANPSLAENKVYPTDTAVKHPHRTIIASASSLVAKVALIFGLLYHCQSALEERQVLHDCSACCMCVKVLEIVAETTAPARSLEELLEQQPSEMSQAERLAQQEAQEQAEAQLAATLEQVHPAAALFKPRIYQIGLQSIGCRSHTRGHAALHHHWHPLDSFAGCWAFRQHLWHTHRYRMSGTIVCVCATQMDETEDQLQSLRDRSSELAAALKDLRAEEKRTATEVAGVLKEAEQAERQVSKHDLRPSVHLTSHHPKTGGNT